MPALELVLAAAGAAGAVLLGLRPPPRRVAGARLARVATVAGRNQVPVQPRSPAGRRRIGTGLVGLGLGLGAWLAAPPLPLVAAVLVVASLARLGRVLAARRALPNRPVAPAQLAVALDLLSACLASGASLGQAVAAVAEAVEDPLAGRLRSAGVAWRAGADVTEALVPWQDDPALAAVARSLVRATTSGAAPAAAVARAAARQREQARLQAEQAARSVAVWAMLPLGLCFLPAFVLVAVVPVVVGLIRTVG